MNKLDKAKIAEKAYYLWLNDGAPKNNDGKSYWLAAERELTISDVVLEEVFDEVIEIVD